MTWLAGVLAVVLVLLAWRLAVEKRRMDAAGARLERFHAQADERAARAALAPYNGHVDAAPIHPPTINGGRT